MKDYSSSSYTDETDSVSSGQVSFGNRQDCFDEGWFEFENGDNEGKFFGDVMDHINRSVAERVDTNNNINDMVIVPADIHAAIKEGVYEDLLLYSDTCGLEKGSNTANYMQTKQRLMADEVGLLVNAEFLASSGQHCIERDQQNKSTDVEELSPSHSVPVSLNAAMGNVAILANHNREGAIMPNEESAILGISSSAEAHLSLPLQLDNLCEVPVLEAEDAAGIDQIKAEGINVSRPKYGILGSIILLIHFFA
ncbi:hypothetical protein SESBI_25203 [Sesbania bispinosa]|nr:hypothetical protein SESBI_25203 [Sesbania bispinosa]